MNARMPARLPLLRLPILVLLLVLSALLLGAGLARAESPGPTPIAAFEGFSEEEEGEELGEETECEIAEEEVEEGELSQDEADEICKEEARETRKNAANPVGAEPEECILRSAHAQVSLVSHDEKLKLTIGYTTYEPVTAKLEIGHLATIHRHLGRSGVLRQVESLHGDNPPKQIAVQIDIPSTKKAGCPSRRLVLFPR